MNVRETLRDPDIRAALQAALNGQKNDLWPLLCRHSGLPSMRPNVGLATAVAEEVVQRWEQGRALAHELCGIDAERAPAQTPLEFLPYCGTLCVAACVAAGKGDSEDEQLLSDLAADERRLVRDAVALGLGWVGRADSRRVLELGAAFTDGYLQSSALLAALAARPFLDALASPELLLVRLEEAFALAEGAPRSHQRSQGYRGLVRDLGELPLRYLDRFPVEVSRWLEGHANTKSPDLRKSILQVVNSSAVRGHSTSRLAGVRAGLRDGAPPRRDPTTYVGPTRQRGKKVK